MDAKLIVILPKGTRKAFPITDSITIGRDLDCDLKIPLPEISRKHCKLEIDGGELFIEDLNSTNGTFLNGVKVKGRKKLQAGDVISLAGAIGFVIQIGNIPQETEINIDKIEDLIKVKTSPPQRKEEEQAELSATSATATDEDIADEILSESFFLEDEEEEEET